jgi:glycerophosphoryl diester phosphodiesterase
VHRWLKASQQIQPAGTGPALRPALGLSVLLSLMLAACASIDPGPRPLMLSQTLAQSPLKATMESCANGPFYRTNFSIAHRGAPLAYPEHTQEGYAAAARMGAGVIECDVTFTKDLALVCRHSQCDLHRTTNILNTPLAAQCTERFSPASDTQPASAKCCTSDITLAQYKTLCGRRDIVDDRARDISGYLTAPTSPWLDKQVSCGTLLTLDESIQLFEQLGTGHTPELKSPQVDMPFAGMDQQTYASRMLEAYVSAGVDPARVWPQSFVLDDVLYWINNHPQFAAQAVYLDPRGRQPDFRASLADMRRLKAQGINIIAPPIPMLLRLDAAGELQASDYALYARQAGLQIITWTFEAGNAADPDNWLYANLNGFIDHESKMLFVLEALDKKVGIQGIFSDWPGTVTYYANCQGL